MSLIGKSTIVSSRLIIVIAINFQSKSVRHRPYHLIFQLALFCLAVAVSMALPEESFEDYDNLDMEFRGPDGLKKCQEQLKKQAGLFKACVKKGI